MLISLKIVSMFLFFPMITIVGQVDDATKAHNKIKGIYMYQFAKLINWPKEYRSGDFVIGVYGDEELYQQMHSAYTDKLIGNQKIKVNRYISSAEISNCHLLYLSDNKSESLIKIKKKNKTKTIIVGQQEGLLDKGAAINFVIKDSRIKFEINKTSVDKQGLIFGQTLIKLASNIL